MSARGIKTLKFKGGGGEREEKAGDHWKGMHI